MSSKPRMVVALGGNALLRPAQPMTAAVQRENIRIAARALAPIAEEYDLVLAHGNGPQVGLLALQAEAYPHEEPYPLDVLGAQTEGMIGYMIEQELGNLLPFERKIATILTMIEVDPLDPAFTNPTKFVGPSYDSSEAEAIAAEKGWTFKLCDEKLRRVVASPEPIRVFELEPIKWLLEKGTIVICAGGGGIPTAYLPDGTRTLVGAECVIDKDLAAGLLAENLEAELFLMATDAEGVFADWRTPSQRLLSRVTPGELQEYEFAAGSMAPKVDAAIRFVETTGHRAAIGSLDDIGRILDGEAGTSVVSEDEI